MPVKIRIVQLRNGKYEVHKHFTYEHSERSWNSVYLTTRFYWRALREYNRLINKDFEELKKEQMQEIVKIIKE